MIHVPSLMQRLFRPLIPYRKLFWFGFVICLLLFLLFQVLSTPGQPSWLRGWFMLISIQLFFLASSAEVYKELKSLKYIATNSYFYHVVNEWCLGPLTIGVVSILLLAEFGMIAELFQG